MTLDWRALKLSCVEDRFNPELSNRLHMYVMNIGLLLCKDYVILVCNTACKKTYPVVLHRLYTG